jgi:hypothetical protein
MAADPGDFRSFLAGFHAASGFLLAHIDSRRAFPPPTSALARAWPLPRRVAAVVSVHPPNTRTDGFVRLPAAETRAPRPPSSDGKRTSPPAKAAPPASAAANSAPPTSTAAKPPATPARTQKPPLPTSAKPKPPPARPAAAPAPKESPSLFAALATLLTTPKTTATTTTTTTTTSAPSPSLRVGHAAGPAAGRVRELPQPMKASKEVDVDAELASITVSLGVLMRRVDEPHISVAAAKSRRADARRAHDLTDHLMDLITNDVHAHSGLQWLLPWSDALRHGCGGPPAEFAAIIDAFEHVLGLHH